LERSLDLGLFDFRRVRVEAAEFLRLLPGQDAVGAGFVGFCAHVVLFHCRGVGVVFAGAWWAGVDDLGVRDVVSMERSIVTAVSCHVFACVFLLHN